MLRTTLLPIAILFAFNALGQDFRSVNFGMTINEVKAIEHLPYISTQSSNDGPMYVYGPEDLLGYDFFVVYAFNNSLKLWMGGYMLMKPLNSVAETQQLYLAIHRELMRKYKEFKSFEIDDRYVWNHPNDIEDGSISLVKDLRSKTVLITYSTEKFLSAKGPRKF